MGLGPGVQFVDGLVRKADGTPINPATEEKQNSAITELQAIKGKDFATQTTLLTLLTQSRFNAVFGTVGASPPANTVLERLKQIQGDGDAVQTLLNTISGKQTDGSQRVGVLGYDGSSLASLSNPLPVQKPDAARLANAEFNENDDEFNPLDFVVDAAGDVTAIYSGLAQNGDDAATTSILVMRVTFDANGNPTERTFATGAWDDRVGLTYEGFL